MNLLITPLACAWAAVGVVADVVERFLWHLTGVDRAARRKAIDRMDADADWTCWKMHPVQAKLFSKENLPKTLSHFPRSGRRLLAPDDLDRRSI